MADLSTRVGLLSTRIANYIRDSVFPRLVPPGGTSGQVLQKTSATDYDLGWASPSTSGTITSLQAALSANVSLTTTGVWYDGPSITLSTGKWLVCAFCSFQRNASIVCAARISDGTNHYASGQCILSGTAESAQNVSIQAIIDVTSNKTVKLQGVTTTGNSVAFMLSSATIYSSGNNATQINAIKIA